MGKTMKLILISLVLLFSACGGKISKFSYVVTEKGLMTHGVGYCTFGVLTNHRRINILDSSSMTIACSGYIMLTREEAANWRPE